MAKILKKGGDKNDALGEILSVSTQALNKNDNSSTNISRD